jgi:hypothetical protein
MNHISRNDNIKSISHPLPGQTILKTGTGSIAYTALNLTANSTLELNQTIANVSIDTSCMKNAKLLISFNGIIGLRDPSFNQYLFTFSLIRICKNSKTPEILNSFDYSFIHPGNEPDDRSLTFKHSFCDDSCSNCCIYALQLTNITSSTNSILNFSINNGILSILAVDSIFSIPSEINDKCTGNTILSSNSNISYTKNFIIEGIFGVGVQEVNDIIGTVSIDTTYMKKPKLLLDFTGIFNIFSATTFVTTSLALVLSKVCKCNKIRIPLTTFTVLFGSTQNVVNSRTFKFEYSPCDDICDSCCTYILELATITSITQVQFNLTINNASFSALAFDCSQNSNKCNKSLYNSIFSSNTSSLSPGLLITVEQSLLLLNLPIVSTTIDTSNLHSPNLLIGFSGILSIGNASRPTYTFTLYKVCQDYYTKEPLKTFVYTSLGFIGNEAMPIKFEYTYCNESSCGCCTYIFELTNIISDPIIPQIGVSNAVLSIIASECST